MITMKEVLLLAVALSLVLETSASTPIFQADPSITSLSATQSTEIRLANLTIPHNDDTVSCNLKTPSPPFALWAKLNETGYSLYYSPNLGQVDVAKSPYTVTVVCRSEGSFQQTSETSITVNVIKNSPPSFPAISGSATADATKPVANSIITNIIATDKDNDTLIYSITSTSQYASYFTINATTGQITATKSLLGIDADSVNLQVMVKDGINPPTGPYSLTVIIANRNTPPGITYAPDSVTVLETEQGGKVIAHVSVKDASAVNPYCSVTSPLSESSKFSFKPTTGELTLVASGSLDYTATPSYTVTCTASDGYLSSTSTFPVTVIDVNDPPKFTKPRYYCSLYESDSGVSVCNLAWNITDHDGDAIAQTSLVQNSLSDNFLLDPVRKQLKFATTYDVDKGGPSSVILNVATVDVRGATGTAEIEVSIADINDNAPRFIKPSGFTIVEGQSLGCLTTVTTSDDDLTSPNNDVTYSLDSCSPACSNYFSVVGKDICYYKSLDYLRSDTTFLMTVKATDGGSPALTSTTQIPIIYYVTTTTSTTTTTTTTTRTTTTTQATTTAYNFFNYSENVAIFATLISLLILGILGGLLAALMGCCNCGGGGAGDAAAETGSAFNCCRSRTVSTPVKEIRRVEPDDTFEDDDFFRTSPTKQRPNSDYKDPFWKDGDDYESGMYNGRDSYVSRPKSIDNRSLVLTPRNLKFEERY